ncbi:MAG: WYL domain-containing protein [Eubacterium sp.]|nr:WYL domain-containing protein [Eubacterium sp.]
MAKSENQKQKILVLLDLFKSKTDEEHGVTTSDIIDYLAEHGIKAERKTVYADLNTLKEYGYEISKEKKDGNYYYTLLDRDFQLPELKLLVDAVQASKFISAKKSSELIKKIENLASVYQAKQLQRQVFVSNRIKTNYENVYYNVDELNLAINENRKIKFDYYEWNLSKEMVLRKNGHKNDISPWSLAWDDENYYLVAFDGNSGIIKHYRVDKMRKIEILDEERDGREEFEEFDAAKYAKKVFGMFTGDEQRVKIQFDNKLIGVVIDRFGQDIMIIPKGVDQFVVNVNVKVSNMFLGWIIGLGDGAKILEPESVVDEVKQITERLKEQYK